MIWGYVYRKFKAVYDAETPQDDKEKTDWYARRMAMRKAFNDLSVEDKEKKLLRWISEDPPEDELKSLLRYFCERTKIADEKK